MSSKASAELISHSSVKLSDVVKKMGNGAYVIPLFQRDFVWRDRGISELMDSIIRKYPISSILLMPVEGALKVKYRPLMGDTSKTGTSDYIYVLDGQQRLTSIRNLFFSVSTKIYYIDLLEVLRFCFPKEETITEEFDRYVKKNNIKSHIKYDTFYNGLLCQSFAQPKGEIPSAKGPANRYILLKNVIEDNFLPYLIEFISIYSKDSDRQKYLNKLNSVISSVKEYRISVTNISEEADLDLIIRIFEKVNSTGVKLTLFDLINAKTFISDNQGFSRIIDQDLSKKSSQGANLFFHYSEEAHTDDAGGLFKKKDSIVRILFLADAIRQGRLPVLNKKEMLLKSSDFWLDRWQKDKENLFVSIDRFYRECLLDYSLSPFLEYILAIYLAYPKIIKNNHMLKAVKKYSLSRTLANSSFSKSDMSIVSEFIDYAVSLTDTSIIVHGQYEPPRFPVDVTIDLLKGIKIRSNAFKAVMAILYNEKPGGFFAHDITGKPISSNIFRNPDFDLHHIIPKSILHSGTRKIGETVGNLVYIDSTVNRDYIKNQPFGSYIKALGKEVGEGFENYLNENLITFEQSDLLTQEEQKKIIYNRLNKIKQVVEKYLK